MYRNLLAEMARYNVSRKDIADALGVRYATIVEKINKKYDFTYSEALAIKNTFFKDCNLEYLFENREVS